MSNPETTLPEPFTPPGTEKFTAWALASVGPLRAAIWRAMMEIENDGADAAYETLRAAWEAGL